MDALMLTEETKSKHEALLREIRNELVPHFRAEVERYKTQNKKPMVLNIPARRRWRSGLKAIRRKYEKHEVLHALNKLQDSCEHDFGTSHEGEYPTETISVCRYCGLIRAKDTSSGRVTTKREFHLEDV